MNTNSNIEIQLNPEVLESKFTLFSGLDYLKIDIANNAGLDKQDYPDRIEWVNNHFKPEYVRYAKPEELRKLVDNIDKEYKLDEPVQVYAGLLAYKDYLEDRPSGYMIALDSIASGTQIMSALTADPVGLHLCGALGNKRTNLYQTVFDVFNQLGEMWGGETFDINQFEYKDIKKAIMTSNYGSKAEPLNLLGKQNLPRFVEAMQVCCSGAWMLKERLVNTWDSNSNSQDWILPDNFHVVNPVMVNKFYQTDFLGSEVHFSIRTQGYKERGISNAANLVHSVDGFIMREVVRRCHFDESVLQRFSELLIESMQTKIDYELDYESESMFHNLLDRYNSTGIVSMRIVDYVKDIEDTRALPLDYREKLLQITDKMLLQGSFDIAVVHDSFKVLPNDANYLRYWYNDVLANICDSNLLYNLLGQMDKQPDHKMYKVSKQEKEQRKQLGKHMRNSNYTIC